MKSIYRVTWKDRRGGASVREDVREMVHAKSFKTKPAAMAKFDELTRFGREDVTLERIPDDGSANRKNAPNPARRG